MDLFGIHINIYFLIFVTIFTLRNIVDLVAVKKPSSKGEGFASLLAFIMFFYITGFSVGFYLFIDEAVNNIFFVAGLFSFMIFYTLRIITIKKMGASYSQFITPNDQSSLITTGFHSVIRHPLYLFYCMELLSMLVVRFNYIALAGIVGDIVITLFRIKKEEELLVKKFGDEYTSYQKQSWKLIPYIC